MFANITPGCTTYVGEHSGSVSRIHEHIRQKPMKACSKELHEIDSYSYETFLNATKWDTTPPFPLCQPRQADSSRRNDRRRLSPPSESWRPVPVSASSQSKRDSIPPLRLERNPRRSRLPDPVPSPNHRRTTPRGLSSVGRTSRDTVRSGPVRRDEHYNQLEAHARQLEDEIYQLHSQLLRASRRDNHNPDLVRQIERKQAEAYHYHTVTTLLISKP